MALHELLEITPGLTAIIGGGGKTTLLYALARELSQSARVIVCTSTHIYPPAHLPCVIAERAGQVEAALEQANCVCVGTRSAHGKFSVPAVSFPELAAMAKYVLVEADGSRGKPLKAHAAHEPVVPPQANQTILVLGASGLGRRICDAAHRPELYAKKLGVPEDTVVTPELAAKLLELENLHTQVLVNQVETEDQLAQAKRLGAALSCRLLAGALLKEEVTCLF